MAEGKEDGVQVAFQDETIWATQKAMAELFDVSVPAISQHLKNIYESAELQHDRTIKKILTVEYLIHPEFFDTKEMYVNIEIEGKYTRGMTVCDKTGRKINSITTTVMVAVNRDEFIKDVLAALSSLNEQLG